MSFLITTSGYGYYFTHLDIHCELVRNKKSVPIRPSGKGLGRDFNRHFSIGRPLKAPHLITRRIYVYCWVENLPFHLRSVAILITLLEKAPRTRSNIKACQAHVCTQAPCFVSGNIQISAMVIVAGMG